jgi:hypothetical protein
MKFTASCAMLIATLDVLEDALSGEPYLFGIPSWGVLILAGGWLVASLHFIFYCRVES